MKVLILVVIITSCQDKTPSFIQEKFKEFPQSQKGETNYADSLVSGIEELKKDTEKYCGFLYEDRLKEAKRIVLHKARLDSIHKELIKQVLQNTDVIVSDTGYSNSYQLKCEYEGEEIEWKKYKNEVCDFYLKRLNPYPLRKPKPDVLKKWEIEEIINKINTLNSITRKDSLIYQLTVINSLMKWELSQYEWMFFQPFMRGWKRYCKTLRKTDSEYDFKLKALWRVNVKQMVHIQDSAYIVTLETELKETYSCYFDFSEYRIRKKYFRMNIPKEGKHYSAALLDVSKDTIVIKELEVFSLW